jgi:hypothetical protein
MSNLLVQPINSNCSNQQLENSLVLQFNEVKALVNGKIYKQKKQVGDYVRKGDIVRWCNNQKIYANLNIDKQYGKGQTEPANRRWKLNVKQRQNLQRRYFRNTATFDEVAIFIIKAIFTEHSFAISEQLKLIFFCK